MKFEQLKVSGAYAINLEKREDDRGFFARYYCESEFKKMGLNTHWVQMNNSLSREKGTLRGLHFQYPPHSEVKLIRCLKGAIWDVIVDIRKGSATYGQWDALELTEENRTMMYAPEGFAHGIITLTEDAEILYMVSSVYSPESEGTLKWDDPFHDIQWPIDPVIISEKDSIAKPWSDEKAVIL
jgi:dTDP-4-dehydrorhamnose 3,5-epimerase